MRSSNKQSKKNISVFIANVIAVASAGLIVLTREPLLFLLMLPAAIYARMNKPATKEEQEKQEELSNRVFAASILTRSIHKYARALA